MEEEFLATANTLSSIHRATFLGRWHTAYPKRSAREQLKECVQRGTPGNTAHNLWRSSTNSLTSAWKKPWAASSEGRKNTSAGGSHEPTRRRASEGFPSPSPERSDCRDQRRLQEKVLLTSALSPSPKDTAARRRQRSPYHRGGQDFPRHSGNARRIRSRRGSCTK